MPQDTHFAILVLIVLICNIIESQNISSFNNEFCSNWWVPSISGLMLFLILEFLGHVFYFGFIIHLQ